MWLWRDNRSRYDTEASREVSRSELVRISVLTSVLGSRPTLPHGFSVTRGDISRYEIHSRVRRISTGIFSSRSCAKVDPCAQPMTEGEVHARCTCRKNQPPHSPARHLSDTRRSSDEHAHNDLRFDSNMEMTAWVLIVGNVSTICIAHPEGARVSA